MRRAAVGVVWVLALLVPAGGLSRFDGIPLTTALAATAVFLVALALASSRVRATLHDWTDRVGPRAPAALVVLGLLVLVAKLLLVTLAPEPGFVACYTNPIYPRPHGACERSFDRPFDDGATRIDEVIDFGPRADADDRTSLLGSNWDLSFVNDTRLNVYPEPGAIDVRRLPFSARWTGTVDGGDGGWIPVTYVGAGRIRVGDRTTRLPNAARAPRTVAVRIGAGDQGLDLQYRFADTVRIGSTRELGPYATVRVGNVSPTRAAPADGGLLRTVPAGTGWQLLAAVVDLALLAFVLVCLAALAVNLACSRRLLVVTVALGVVAVVVSTGHAGFAALELPIAPSVLALALLYGWLVWRRPDDLLLFGIPAAVVVSAERVLSIVPNLHSVVFRDRGSDWQTYQAFARAILEQRSLEGGESVFYYQPGFRYWAFAGHLGFGDGDALPTIVGMSLLLTAVLLLTRWSLGRGLRSTDRLPLASRVIAVAAGIALLVAFTASPILELVVLGASEYPTWCIIPLLLPLLFTRPTWTRWIGGSALLGATVVLRPNQGVPALALFVVFVAVHYRAELRRVAFAAATFVAVLLLPLLHNLWYGGKLELLPTGASSVEDLPPSRLLHLLDDAAVRRALRDKLAALLYLTPRADRDALLGLAFLAIQVLWITVVVRAVRRRRALPRRTWFLLAWPLAFAVPSIFYDVFIYYPRHIVAMYVAAASAALFVEVRYVAAASSDPPDAIVTRMPSSRETVGS